MPIPATPSLDPTTPPPTVGAAGPPAPIEVVVHPGPAGKAGLRVVALWEAVKGLLVLLAGGLAVYFLRPDQERSIERFVNHFHLNPASHTSHIFQRALDHLQNPHLVLVASGALAYAALHFAEAYGLWFERRWGWILGLVSAGIYLPFEILELTRRVSPTSVGLFVANLAIIALLWRNRTRHVVVA